MRMYDIISAKKQGLELSEEEISFFVRGFTNGDIPKYQMSALLMAICLQGMTSKETMILTKEMAKSGDIVDLSIIKGKKVDKHSTGGVGDKTTLIISAIVASLGVPIAKMSGRGLGHTGGTIDKLESIPGFKTSFSQKEFIDIVNKVGICISGQSGNLAPADKKIYALRDVTATVDSIPLIASSIMSKKIAAGADNIVLDVKTGSGAFMKTLEGSIDLAKAMVDIGESVGRKMVALVTDMDTPLGYAIGNTLEVLEVIDVLNGKGPKDLIDICIDLATEMLYVSDKGTLQECKVLAKESLESGNAFNKFLEMVESQGGDTSYITNPNKFEKANICYEVKSHNSGYISKMDVEGIGIASCILGAGREFEGEEIDYSSGIILNKKTNDIVKEGDIIAFLHTSTLEKAKNAEEKILSSLEFSNEKPNKQPIIYARVDKDNIIRY